MWLAPLTSDRAASEDSAATLRRTVASRPEALAPDPDLLLRAYGGLTLPRSGTDTGPFHTVPLLLTALLNVPPAQSSAARGAILDALADLLSGWSRPSDADGEQPEPASSPPSQFVTPPSYMPGDAYCAANKRKRPSTPGESDPHGTQSSASPSLKKGKTTIMKRTPQPNLAQSRLTSSGGTLALHGTGAAVDPPAAPLSTEVDPPNAPTGMAAVTPVVQKIQSEALSADFFRNLIGENTKTVTAKIDAMSADIRTLTRSVAANSSEIGKNTEELKKQAEIIVHQKSALDELSVRVATLESQGNAGRPPPPDQLPRKSPEYLRARRSVRIWPIDGSSEDSLWRGTGDFIHSALGISEEDVGQDDIESVTAVPNPKFRIGNVREEAIVTFFSHVKRDAIMSGAVNLATHIDAAGQPTAGIRLELPPELMDTFRLLSRFGTRLRARHGDGTKRHVKFDDMEASLYMNIKLPGDESWSRVSPQTAKADLDKATRTESADILRRIAAPAAPTSGPRGRLAAPTGNTTSTVQRPSNITGRGADGVRVRAWTPRDTDSRH